MVCEYLPILITYNFELSTIDWQGRTYINVMKAEWARYAEACNKYLAEDGETTNFEHADMTFRKAATRPSGHFIPAGRIKHF